MRPTEPVGASRDHPAVMMRLALSSLLLGFFPFGGCNDDEFVSCEDDVLGCEEDLSFELDPSCSEAEMSGEIELVIGNGDGEGGFRALELDELPEIHHGSQGGSHMWTGVQIRNANLERRLHRIELAASSCSAELDCSLESSWSANEADAEPPRELVVDGATLDATADGWLELRDVLLILPWAFDDSEGARQRLTVTVQDSCDRWGQAVLEQ